MTDTVTGNAEHLTTFLQTRTSRPVLLVGHSYGGAVIGAAETMVSTVTGVVHVNAFVPAEGEGARA